MTAVLNIVIPVLAILAIGVTIYYGLRVFRHKATFSQEAYNVGQLDARQAMQVDMLRAGAALIVALILLGVIGLSPKSDDIPVDPVLDVTATPTILSTATVNIPTGLPDTAVPVQPQATEALLAPPATPTEPVAIQEPTPLPTDTPPSSPQTAVVTSEVGVWLRSAPSTVGEQVEWLLNSTELIILPGKETADDLEWQQVRVPSGNEGWVANLFITYNE